jgi:hypothetical protein
MLTGLLIALWADPLAAQQTLNGQSPGGAYWSIQTPAGWRPGDGLVLVNHGYDAEAISTPRLARDRPDRWPWRQAAGAGRPSGAAGEANLASPRKSRSDDGACCDYAPGPCTAGSAGPARAGVNS